MNQITKRNRLKDLMDRYSDFIRTCPEDSTTALVEEMLNIAYELEKIKQMGLRELQQQVEDFTLTFESKANYMEDFDETSIILLKKPANSYGRRTA